MPTIRFDDRGEGEGITGAGRPLATGGELARVSNNLVLSDHIGKFVAGEVQTRFKNEDMIDMLKGKNAIHISFSWG